MNAVVTVAEPEVHAVRRSIDMRLVGLLVGIAALVVPTLISLARTHWSTDSGAQGPLILISGLWLIWRERADMRFRPGSISSKWLWLLGPLLAVYAYARTVGILGTETVALYLVLLLLALFYWPRATIQRLSFVLVYFAFLIKPPFGLLAELTQPLKAFISQSNVSVLSAFGLPVGASGVVIQIGQYELLVKEACAGLGSLFTLLALGLLYVHLTNARGTRAAILISAILPIAVVANLLRVMIIVLLTYYAGNGVAQGFAHELAGLLTFGCSMVGLFALDASVCKLRPIS